MQTSQTSESKSIKCEICGDKGVYKNDQGYWKECKCHAEQTKLEIKQNKQRAACEFAKMPNEFKDIKLDDYRVNTNKTNDDAKKTVNAKRIATAYIKRFKEMQAQGTSLYLKSNAKGTGKTMLSVAIGNELMTTGITVRYATMIDILSKIKNTFNSREENELKLINELQEVEMLILDDLDIEKVTDWGNEKVYSIINQRMIANKPLIITSNVSIDDLGYDERIKNRLTKMCIEVEMPEKSIRTAISKASNEKILNSLLGEDVGI